MSDAAEEIAPPLAEPPVDWREAAQPRHRICGEALAWALAAGEWDRAALIWEARLTREERVTMLGLFIRACAPDDAVELMDAALADMAPGPSPYRLGTLAEEARFWAGMASEAERKHYLLAAFAALSRRDRLEFMRAAQRIVLE